MNVNTAAFCVVFLSRELTHFGGNRLVGNERARWRDSEGAEPFQRPGRLSLHEVNAAGDRLDGNEWYVSLGVASVINAVLCCVCRLEPHKIFSGF